MKGEEEIKKRVLGQISIIFFHLYLKTGLDCFL